MYEYNSTKHFRQIAYLFCLFVFLVSKTYPRKLSLNKSIVSAISITHWRFSLAWAEQNPLLNLGLGYRPALFPIVKTCQDLSGGIHQWEQILHPWMKGEDMTSKFERKERIKMTRVVMELAAFHYTQFSNYTERYLLVWLAVGFGSLQLDLQPLVSDLLAIHVLDCPLCV